MPDVCAASRRQRVDYVLTGGDMHIWGVLDHTPEYSGVDSAAYDPDFKVVAEAGPYALRRVPDCSTAAPGSGFIGPVTIPEASAVNQAPAGWSWPGSSFSTAAR